MWSKDPVMGPLLACLVGMAVGAGATWLVGWIGKRLFHKEAMGLGDVKFMAFVGGLLGWQLVVLVFFLAPMFGAVVGLVQLLRTRDHHIAYGPFLSLAAVIAVCWGDKIFKFIGLTDFMRGS
jgi:leader peptidase (prepilin peptidase)/N-methyltransferase